MRMQMGEKKDASDEAVFDCRVGPMIIKTGSHF